MDAKTQAAAVTQVRAKQNELSAELGQQSVNWGNVLKIVIGIMQQVLPIVLGQLGGTPGA